MIIMKFFSLCAEKNEFPRKLIIEGNYGKYLGQEKSMKEVFKTSLNIHERRCLIACQQPSIFDEKWKTKFGKPENFYQFSVEFANKLFILKPFEALPKK